MLFLTLKNTRVKTLRKKIENEMKYCSHSAQNFVSNYFEQV